jgi:hypothetical protein
MAEFDSHGEGQHKVRRRGLMAGLAAAGAAALLKMSGPSQAQAADGGPVILGAENSAGPGRTVVHSSSSPGFVGYHGTDPYSYLRTDGLQGFTEMSGGAGVFGESFIAGNIGVMGRSGTTSTGVFGSTSTTTPPVSARGVSVFGLATGALTAVKGEAVNGYAVWGVSSGAAGVLGTTVGAFAVQGAASANGTGGVFSSVTGLGLSGTSTSFVGVLGRSTNSIGVYGQTSEPSQPALYAENIGGGQAARFVGSVVVNGNFSVIGGAKAAVVTLPDGSQRTMYCQEAPEPYFEDFGRGQLQNGVARVQLDADFAALVALDSYMVFVTPGGESQGLYVGRQDARGFEVRENAGRSSIPFTYRVVAKRRDIPGGRLARVDANLTRKASSAERPNVAELKLPSDAFAPSPVSTAPEPQRIRRGGR